MSPARAFLLFLVGLAGCGNITQTFSNTKLEKKVLRELSTSNSDAAAAFRQFQEKWPNSESRIGIENGGPTGSGEVIATTIIEGRYQLDAHLAFQKLKDSSNVEFPSIRFELQEILRVTPSGDGVGVGIRYRKLQRQLTLAEWRKVTESNWSFSSLGITIVSNAPIPNISALAKTLSFSDETVAPPRRLGFQFEIPPQTLTLSS
jgi:hypothetical protein